MKKLLLTIFMVLTFGWMNAQVAVWLGPRAGVNLASVTDVDGSTKIGAYGGASLSINFSKRYALQPEIGFSMQGTKEVYNSHEDLKLTYFTLGVMNKLYLAEGFHLLVGPEFNFKVNDTFSDWVEDEIYDGEGNYIGEIDAQPFDFVLVGGLGYDFPFGLSLEARYKQGLQDVMDFFNWDDGKSRLNQVFQIGVVYRFHLNK